MKKDRLAEIAARAAEIEEELTALYELDELDDEQAARCDELEAEVQRLADEAEQIEARNEQLARATQLARVADNIERGYDAPKFNKGSLADTDIDPLRASRSEVRDAALRRNEALEMDLGDITDEVRAQLEGAIRGSTVKDSRGVVGGLVLTTTTDAYRSAFQKGLAGRNDLWTPEEREAVARASEFRAAMGLTDANGGYGVPVHLDPTVILTNDGAQGAIRSLARVERITTNQWNGLSSAGVTAGWGAEFSEVSDGSPTFGQPSVEAHKAHAFVQGSIEIVQDFRGLESEIMMMFADAKARLEAPAFINGDGSGKPLGVVAGLMAEDGTPNVVDPSTPEAFSPEVDVYNVKNALAVRWRGNGVFVAAPGTIDVIRQAGAERNTFLVDLGGATPTRLIGYPLAEDENMADASQIDDTKSEDNPVLLFGDFKAGYLIVDRVGMAVEYVPHVFHTDNNLPMGVRGWYAYWRVGAGLINSKALKVLNVATSA